MTNAKNENIARSERGRVVMEAYRKIMAEPVVDDDTLLDLLADLMHTSRENEFDFDSALASARANFEAEVQEERDEVAAQRGEDKGGDLNVPASL